LVTIGDQVFTEEDYRRWIDGSRIYPASREAEHMHGLFAQSALDNAFVDAQPLPDEDLFANRWAATRAHLIASSLVRQAIRRHPPTEEELGAILEARWRDHPQLILREISVIRLSTAPAWGEEEIPAHYLLQRAQASAEMIATRFADGEDFAQLARDFSDAPSAEEGGHLGWVGEPSAPDIDTPLRGTGEGQVTAPHRTPTALLIYHVNAVRPKPFGEARRALESIWFGEREQEIGLALFHALDDEGPVDWTQRLERAAAEDFLPTGD
ncbi:peptidylprolyl isomerase, partial [Candidatus Sumerlaeota bacterium]|nr:peptidylprolyl isomerase [Candidatus Sumerlaeota bacterium]